MQFILGLKNKLPFYQQCLCMWGEWVYEDFMNLTVNFFVILKLFFKKMVSNKNNTQDRHFWQNFCFTFTCAKLLQLCPILCDPMDCSLPGSSVHGILQSRILEWVTISSSRGSSWLEDGVPVSCVSCVAGKFFASWAIIYTHTVYVCVLVGLWFKVFFWVKNVCRPL